ncbi:hypothetical protein ILUMI_00323 [Ignelater luminosus]|uniref:Uncharacterized protein n=1 Tax=Ignelater luminosus TaxID=2038154 RepID=A0A8K0GN74_IGNLU|nr:hypothetical protein ILUMI_00323 [Ignelater luminosus]
MGHPTKITTQQRVMYLEHSGQRGEDSDVPNMNSNTNDLEDNNETSSYSGKSNASTDVSELNESEEDEQVVNNTIWFNNNMEHLFPDLLYHNKDQGNQRSRALKSQWQNSMKPYLPMKPIKRRTKIWIQSDSSTGFLASVMLLNELEELEQEKCIKIFKKLNCTDSQFRVNNEGTIVCRWQDTKDALATSNCFSDTITELKRIMKDGTRKDQTSQIKLLGYMALIENLPSGEKKVFYKLLVTIANAHVLHNDLHTTKTPFLPFLIRVAKGLVSLGRSKAAVKRRSATSLGRPPKIKKSRTGILCPAKKIHAEDVSDVLLSSERKYGPIRSSNRYGQQSTERRRSSGVKSSWRVQRWVGMSARGVDMMLM